MTETVFLASALAGILTREEEHHYYNYCTSQSWSSWARHVGVLGVGGGGGGGGCDAHWRAYDRALGRLRGPSRPRKRLQTTTLVVVIASASASSSSSSRLPQRLRGGDTNCLLRYASHSRIAGTCGGTERFKEWDASAILEQSVNWGVFSDMRNFKDMGSTSIHIRL